LFSLRLSHIVSLWKRVQKYNFLFNWQENFEVFF
jgi:hypothetical protein